MTRTCPGPRLAASHVNLCTPWRRMLEPASRNISSTLTTSKSLSLVDVQWGAFHADSLIPLPASIKVWWSRALGWTRLRGYDRRALILSITLVFWSRGRFLCLPCTSCPLVCLFPSLSLPGPVIDGVRGVDGSLACLPSCCVASH